MTDRGLPFSLVVTCEHGGNDVPRRWGELFQGRRAAKALESHRGWDPGALPLAVALARRFDAPLVHATVSRLLVDLNRSETNRTVFSEFSRVLDGPGRQELVERYHRPFREEVETRVTDALARGRVLHVSVHSFTPVLDGTVRLVDLSLLYDPGRPGERALCRAWAAGLTAALPELRIRRNQPYRGTSDGHTTALRRRFGPQGYLGVEIEVNQGLLDARGRTPQEVTTALGDALVCAAGEV